jgi:hypothetical protein
MTPGLRADLIRREAASTTTSPGSMFGGEAAEVVSGLGAEVLVA